MILIWNPSAQAVVYLFDSVHTIYVLRFKTINNYYKFLFICFHRFPQFMNENNYMYQHFISSQKTSLVKSVKCLQGPNQDFQNRQQKNPARVGGPLKPPDADDKMV